LTLNRHSVAVRKDTTAAGGLVSQSRLPCRRHAALMHGAGAKARSRFAVMLFPCTIAPTHRH
jgi:hypothetical protein